MNSKCPYCGEEITTKLINHLRFKHQFTTDDMFTYLFVEIGRLSDRISNLCELLEIREK